MLGIHFQEIAGDFIRDNTGKWWLVNIHGFLIDKCPLSIDVTSITNCSDFTSSGIMISPSANISVIIYLIALTVELLDCTIYPK